MFGSIDAQTVLIVLGALALKAGLAYFTILRGRQGSTKEVKIPYRVFQQAALDLKRKQVLVTGGCGFLGRHIVELLLDRFSDKIQVHVLDAGVKPANAHPDVTYIQGDIRVLSHVMAAMDGKAAVVHCAALVEGASTPMSLMREVNVQGTRNVVEACLEKETKVLVYTSSVSVHFTAARKPQMWVKEDDPMPEDKDLLYDYARTKRDAERLVLAANGHVVRTVALRPGGIHGVGDKAMTDPTLSPEPNLVGSTFDFMVPYVWVRDCARAHVLALLRLLTPADHAALALAARPWCCSATHWDPAASTAYGYPVHDDKLFNAVFGADGNSVPAVSGGSIAGKAIALTYEQDPAAGVDHPVYRAFNGAAAGPSTGVSAWGWKAKGSIPYHLVMALAHINKIVARCTGVTVFPENFFPANVEVVCRPCACDVTRARTLLGWRPLPWRTVRHIEAAQWESEHGLPYGSRRVVTKED